MSGMKIKRYCSYIFMWGGSGNRTGEVLNSHYGTQYQVQKDMSVRRTSPKMHIKKNKEVSNG